MAEFKINSTSDLEKMLKYIEKQAQDSLRLISLEVEKMMKDYVIKNLYLKYEPNQYLRSEEYVNSLTVTKVYKNSDGGLETEIYFDPEKIHSRELQDEVWNQHMSLNGDSEWKGESISTWIPIWMEHGVHGNTKWKREGIEVVNNMLIELDNNGEFKKMMMNELRKKGFKVEQTINIKWYYKGSEINGKEKAFS